LLSTPAEVFDGTCFSLNLGSHAIMKAGLDGTHPVELATTDDAPGGMALTATHVYWTAVGGVSRVPLSGGAPTVVASVELDCPGPIAVDASGVYWGDRCIGTPLMTVGLAGGTPVTLTRDAEAVNIALDAKYVYWTTGVSVMKLPK